jgi:hypothetical protein
MMGLGTLRYAERICPMPFSNYRDNFDPETLAILEAAVVRECLLGCDIVGTNSLKVLL